jgi:hypothetical protein
MSFLATLNILGTGAPRLIRRATSAFYTSSGTNTTYTATSITETGADLSAVKSPMHVWALMTTGEYTYAKITDVNNSTKVITVDAWSNGTPPSNAVYTVDGYVVDLPRCQRLVETRAPDYLTHELYNGDAGTRLETEFRGWKYDAELNYEQYMRGEDAALLRYVLNMNLTDRLVLIPRRSNPEWQYNVVFTDPVSVSLAGVRPGVSGLILRFKGKENIHEWPLADGYGYGYATSYGTNL